MSYWVCCCGVSSLSVFFFLNSPMLNFLLIWGGVCALPWDWVTMLLTIPPVPVADSLNENFSINFSIKSSTIFISFSNTSNCNWFMQI